MKKNRKVLFVVGGLFFAIMAIAVMLTLKSKESKTKSVQQTFSNAMVSYMNEGVLQENGDYILFSNPQTGQTNIICDDPKCSHEKSENSKCGAVIDANLKEGLNIYKDSLCFVSDYKSNDYWKTAIFQADLNGKNRKKIADLTSMEYIYNVAYFGDDIYISYCNSGQFEDTVGIYHYNMARGKGKIIYSFTKCGANMFGLAIDNNGLYFSLGYMDLSAKEIEKHKNDEEYIKKFRKSFIIGLRKTDGQELFRTEGTVIDYLLPCIEGSLYFVHNNSTIRYHIKECRAEKISSTERYGLCSTCTDGVYFRGYDATEGKNCAYYVYYPDNGKWRKLGESNVRIEAVFPEYAYGETIAVDAEGAETAGYVYLKKEDFLAGRIDKATLFELQDGIE